MLVFVSGSINSGKTTVSKIVADKLGAVFLNLDDIRDEDKFKDIPFEKVISKVIEEGTKRINLLTTEGKDVVANYVLTKKDWQNMLKETNEKHCFFITLAPRLEVALSNRGKRELTDWLRQRIKYHYDIGINDPGIGIVVDNSDMTPEEAASRVLSLLAG